MRIALAITSQYSLQTPPGLIFAPIPLHLGIARGLSAKGHEVTIFCTEDTKIEAPLKKYSGGLYSIDSKRLAHPENNYGQVYINASDNILFSEMYRMANEGKFDIILNSDPARTIHFVKFTNVPTLFTLHDPLHSVQHVLLENYTQYTNHW